jgi:hypothetical protein
VVVVVKPSPLEQLILIRKRHRKKIVESNSPNHCASSRTYVQVEAHAEGLCRRHRAVQAIVIAVALWLFAHAMDSQPTRLSVPAFTAPALPIALGVVYRRNRQAGQAILTYLVAALAPQGEVGGADPMAPSGCAPVNVGTRKSSANWRAGSLPPGYSW